MLWEHEPHPQLFRVLPNFHECLYNSIETRYMFSISLRGKGKQLVNFDYQNVNSLCSRHHYVNSARLGLYRVIQTRFLTNQSAYFLRTVF